MATSRGNRRRSEAVDAAETRVRTVVAPTHVVYGVRGAAPPGPESLGVEVRIDGGRSCVGLRNPGPDWVPLYPARRLTLAPAGNSAGRVVTATWLPLDRAPGAEHVARPGAERTAGISGTIEDGGRRWGFAVGPGQPTAPLRGDRP